METPNIDALLAYESQVMSPFPDISVIGSNSWVVDGSKSTTGYPVLANDPHLQLQLPSLWYEVHLVVPGEINVQGGSLAGTPAVLIGHTEHVSWGMTNVGADVLDLFVEEVNPSNSSQYRYNGEWIDFEVVNELIHTADGNMVEFPVSWSVHGPCVDSLIDDYGPAEDNFANLAMNWTGTGVTHEILALSMLNLANDMNGYFDALYWWDSPPQNFIYADDSGNIAITVAGRFPVRTGYSGKYPVAGLNDSVGMTSSIPYAHIPRSVNPSQGYLQSANQLSINPAVYAYSILGPQSDSYRGRRIDHLLATDSDVTVEDMMVYQADVLDVSAESMVGFVVDGWENSDENNASIQGMVDILASWDFVMSTDSAAPTIWRYLLGAMKRSTFDEVSAAGLNPMSVRTPVLEQILTTEDEYYIDDHETAEIETLEDIVVLALHQCYNDLAENIGTNAADWIYGAHHTLNVEHLAGFTHLGGTPHPGSRYTLNVGAGWTVDAGPSRRMVVRHGTSPGYYTTYPGGQSGNMFSQHWSDLFDLWNRYDETTNHYGYTEEHFYASVAEFVDAGTGIEQDIIFIP
jgi:penicillin amidase